VIIVDGKKIAERIKGELKREISSLSRKARLAIVEVGENKVSRKFIEQKKKFADEIRVDVREYKFPADISTNALRKKLAEIVHLKQNTGVIIQLPLPTQINVQYILNSVPPEKDVDVLSARALGNFATGKSRILPPVVSAVEEIFKEYGVDIAAKTMVLVGAGRLVGRPLAMYFLQKPATLIVANESTENLKSLSRLADILISGVGKSGFITGDFIKQGAIAIDFGVSESNGALTGDFDFESVKEKAGLITPAPGGVGPIVVASLFKNLFALAKIKKQLSSL
jgi:methylenetetrahydrofolate dehydrogenase (NADP+)/methenyltetrahydrofolate cyclohydrolase